MTSLWTIEEAPMAEYVRGELDKALDAIEFEKAKEHLNRHRWDRQDSRDLIKVRLYRAILASEKLLRMMGVTDSKELGK